MIIHVKSCKTVPEECCTNLFFFLLHATYIQRDFIFSNIFQRYCTYFLSNTSFRCISDTETVLTFNRLSLRPHKITNLDLISLLTYLRLYCNFKAGTNPKKNTNFLRDFEFRKKPDPDPNFSKPRSASLDSRIILVLLLAVVVVYLLRHSRRFRCICHL